MYYINIETNIYSNKGEIVMAKTIRNIVLMLIGVIIAFYLVVLLTAWIKPGIVFLLVMAIAIASVVGFVKI